MNNEASRPETLLRELCAICLSLRLHYRYASRKSKILDQRATRVHENRHKWWTRSCDQACEIAKPIATRDILWVQALACHKKNSFLKCTYDLRMKTKAQLFFSLPRTSILPPSESGFTKRIFGVVRKWKRKWTVIPVLFSHNMSWSFKLRCNDWISAYPLRNILFEKRIGKFFLHSTPVSLTDLSREKCFEPKTLKTNHWSMKRKISQKVILHFYVTGSWKGLKFNNELSWK